MLSMRAQAADPVGDKAPNLPAQKSTAEQANLVLSRSTPKLCQQIDLQIEMVPAIGNLANVG